MAQAPASSLHPFESLRDTLAAVVTDGVGLGFPSLYKRALVAQVKLASVPRDEGPLYIIDRVHILDLLERLSLGPVSAAPAPHHHAEEDQENRRQDHQQLCRAEGNGDRHGHVPPRLQCLSVGRAESACRKNCGQHAFSTGACLALVADTSHQHAGQKHCSGCLVVHIVLDDAQHAS